MTDLYAPLVQALQRRQAEYRDGIEKHLGEDAVLARELLREAVELVGCLRRILPSVTPDELYRAFGAPGDFGYNTPIGDALYRIYFARPGDVVPSSNTNG